MKLGKLAVNVLVCCLVHLPGFSAELFPLKQGLHQWKALDGKMFLVVGTYQDTSVYRRTYNFFFQQNKEEEWNQVPINNKKGEHVLTWNSAIGGDVILADGTVVSRPEGLYFIVADKRATQTYEDKSTIDATWYKLVESGDDRPDDLPYQLKPIFSRAYPNSKLTVEEILSREANLRPIK